MGPSGAGEMAAGHPTLREQAAVAAWCRMELLIQVTPDIPLWVGLREGGGLGRAKFRTRLNPSATEQPWPEGVSPCRLRSPT